MIRGDRADRAWLQRDLGADRRICRFAPGKLTQHGAAGGTVPGRLSGEQSAVPADGVADRSLFELNPDIWLSPLMILGTQWYILFNVIAGASAMPQGAARRAADNFGVKSWLWWSTRRACPLCFPIYVTGAITASGGSPGTPAMRGRGGQLGHQNAARPRLGRLYRRRHSSKRGFSPQGCAGHCGDELFRRFW